MWRRAETIIVHGHPRVMLHHMKPSASSWFWPCACESQSICFYQKTRNDEIVEYIAIRYDVTAEMELKFKLESKEKEMES